MNTTEISNEIVDCSTEIEKYASLLDTYGVTVVILAVFIFIFMIIFMLLLRNNHRTTKQLMDQQQQLFDIITSKNKEEKENKENHKKNERSLLKTFVKLDDSIKNVLKKINEEIGASRLSIYVFHNGSYTSHGIPFFKVSCISEIFKKGSGMSSKFNTHTNLPLTMFDQSVKTLFNEGKVLIDDISAIESEYPILFKMFSSSVKSACGVAIYDEDNNILGVIIAEFKSKNDNLTSISETLIGYTTFLEPILTQSKSDEEGDEE